MRDCFSYYVHGFTLHSEIECPELLPASDGSPDVLVRLGSLAHIPHQETDSGKSICIGNMHMLLNVHNAGRFSIKDGREIIIEPAPGVEARTLRLYLLGTALGCIVHQRGLLPLHANAFLHDGAAVLVMAHSGTGKSTLAAAMGSRGHLVLADDVCAVHSTPAEEPLVYPGVPQIKLWRDTAECLGKDVGAMRQIANNEEKYAMPVLSHTYRQGLHIKSLYVLNTCDGGTIHIADMYPLERMHALENYTYRKGMAAKLGIAAMHRRSRAALLGSVRMRRIFRPKNGFLLDALVELIEEDLR